MKYTLSLLVMIGLKSLVVAQTSTNLVGLRFQQYQKDVNTYAILEFSSNKQVNYVMGGVLPFNGKSFRDVCPGTYTITGNKITIKCVCADKDVFPDPLEDSFIYDGKTKVLTSTRYKYTIGSAPASGMAGKFNIWTQL